MQVLFQSLRGRLLLSVCAQLLTGGATHPILLGQLQLVPFVPASLQAAHLSSQGGWVGIAYEVVLLLLTLFFQASPQVNLERQPSSGIKLCIQSPR